MAFDASINIVLTKIVFFYKKFICYDEKMHLGVQSIIVRG